MVEQAYAAMSGVVQQGKLAHHLGCMDSLETQE